MGNSSVLKSGWNHSNRAGAGLLRPAFVGVDHRAAGAVDDPRTERRGIVAQYFMPAEEFGDLGQVYRHRIGHVRHLHVDGLRSRGKSSVLVAVGTAQAVRIVDAEPVEQRMIHPVELDPPVTQ